MPERACTRGQWTISYRGDGAEGGSAIPLLDWMRKGRLRWPTRHFLRRSIEY